jgi:hypothetical protein
MNVMMWDHCTFDCLIFRRGKVYYSVSIIIINFVWTLISVGLFENVPPPLPYQQFFFFVLKPSLFTIWGSVFSLVEDQKSLWVRSGTWCLSRSWALGGRRDRVHCHGAGSRYFSVAYQLIGCLGFFSTGSKEIHTIHSHAIQPHLH